MHRTLVAFYDLAICPVSFNVIAFLVRAKMAQAKASCDQLHVVIVPFAGGQCGKYRDKSEHFDCADLDWRLWNIVVPACALIGASLTIATGWEQAEAIRATAAASWPESLSAGDRPYWAAPIIAAARGGAEIPRLRASAQAHRVMAKQFERYGCPVVTLTMRAARHESFRNHDPEAWRMLGSHIEGCGFAVHVLPDTEEALGVGRGFAELNLDLRMAAYELAVLNIHQTGGPAELVWYSRAPFIDFIDDFTAGAFAKMGIPLEPRMPWFSESQRIVRGAKDAAAMIEAFEAWRPA